MYKALSAIGPMFSIAAAFGNVHGVYKPGNVVLSPHLLGGHQKFIKEHIKSPLDKPAFLVMHGGSGSTNEEISEAVRNGVVKMNIDTDTQWAYWEGLKNFYEKNKGYLQGQVPYQCIIKSLVLIILNYYYFSEAHTKIVWLKCCISN